MKEASCSGAHPFSALHGVPTTYVVERPPDAIFLRSLNLTKREPSCRRGEVRPSRGDPQAVRRGGTPLRGDIIKFVRR